MSRPVLRRELDDARRLLARLATRDLMRLLDACGDSGPYSSILAALLRREMQRREFVEAAA